MLQQVRFDNSTWIPTSVFIYYSFSAFKMKNYCIIHLLTLVLPHWDAFQAEKPILTLGIALTPQIMWKLQSSTRPWNPRDAPRLIHVYTQEQTTAPFIPTSFQVLPTWHLPSCMSVPWISRQPGRGSAASFRRRDIRLWGTGDLLLVLGTLRGCERSI